MFAQLLNTKVQISYRHVLNVVTFLAVWNILQPFGSYCGHLAMWYIFPRFGIMCQEKSGNPDCWLAPYPSEPSHGVLQLPIQVPIKKSYKS
jgi:hypothetical protein